MIGSRILYKILIAAFTSIGAALPAQASNPDQCRLFHDGIQDSERADFAVAKYQTTLLNCHGAQTTGARVALRRMMVHGEPYLLLADTSTLKTQVERESCWKCESASLTSLASSKLGLAISREGQNYHASAGSQVLANAGLKHSEGATEGAFLTADLCPSPHPLDRGLIEDAMKVSNGHAAPIALSISGGWLRHHKEDFVWLKELVRDGKIEIVWVNHSNKHPFKLGVPNQENFLLTPGVNLDQEILETERLLIANGATPSLFFRFPGLISDAAQMDALKKYLLIPLGADAWLATGQKPKNGSILLVHANGNEPLGKKILEKLIEGSHLPLPLHPLSEALKD